MTNLASGRSRTVRSDGPVHVDFATGQLTVAGRHPIFSSTGLVIGEVTGATTVALDEFVIRDQRGRQQPVDACALLDPALPAVIPRRTTPPWGLPDRALAAIVRADTTPLYSPLIRHVHAHLDVFVDGQKVTVPPGVGMVAPEPVPPKSSFESGVGIVTALHTHFDDGILHVEANSPLATRLTLGQFFDEWNVRFTRDCLGAACSSGNRRLSVFVNGAQPGGDPRDIEIVSGDEIAVVFGTPGQPSTIPSSYPFPPDLVP